MTKLFVRAFLLMVGLACSTWAQDSPQTADRQIGLSRSTAQPKQFKLEPGLQPGEDPQNHLFVPILSHIAQDQEKFWTTTTHLQTRDLRWIAPVATGVGTLIAADHWISQQVPDKPDQLKRSLNISNYSAYSMAGAVGGAFLWGHITKNEHLSETGVLAGEAAFNALAVTNLLKYTTQRPRPLQSNGNGTFFQGGDSFPSDHSALAWSIASVVAHEYPGPITKFFAYGLASAVTMTRVTSKQHFASDAVVGSLLGWYFGREVYRARHDSRVGGGAWGNYWQELDESGRKPPSKGSPYVPMDSWVYPAFDRLIALGRVRSAYLGIRPWTRLECARLLDEASERETLDDVNDGEEGKIFWALKEEFRDEIGRLEGAPNVGARVDSVYTRSTVISGVPLRDGYHFGQTLTNDYGRPYWTGFNNVTGISAQAVAGPLSFFVRGEYQHSSSGAF